MFTQASWQLDQVRYFSEDEISFIQANIVDPRKNPELSGARVKEWFLLELGLNTGLRVMEIADLKCGDIQDYILKPSLVVRNGKGSKRREVLIGLGLLKSIQWFLAWKSTHREPVNDDAYLFHSRTRHGKMSRRALQLMFKRAIHQVGIDEDYSIHCLRHTYAVFLYRASNNNVRFVQKQLGHSSIKTTQVYIEVLIADSREALERLYA